MGDTVIKVDHVSMRFNLSSEKVDNMKEYFIRRLKHNMSYDEFWALQDISFDVKKGESVALIGLNGCGKSTLLKTIAGVLKPTKGSIQIQGTIAPMIELGAGFDMDLTARENVYLNGAILGYSRKQMNEYYDGIVDFSELEAFMDVPIKNFSSGMQARLGFAIATLIKPDILIVDEILAVGDAHFQEKCKFKMEELKSGGTTLILVSHDVNQVKETCNHAAWINKGHLMMVGNADEVCDEYMKNKDL